MAIGKKTGGRKPGSKNKMSLAKRDELARMIDKGTSPLEYLLSVMRSEEAEQKERIDAAKAAAPYIHPRLNAVELTGKDGEPIQSETTVTLDANTAERLRRLVE
jgi:hypothetical protein